MRKKKSTAQLDGEIAEVLRWRKTRKTVLRRMHSTVKQPPIPEERAVAKWAYHGVRAVKLDRIRVVGLVPGAASDYTDAYSEYDDGDHLFFADDPEYLRHAYGDTILRFPWPRDTKPDQNKYGRYLAHQFVTKQKVSPANIEVELRDGSWAWLKSLVA